MLKKTITYTDFDGESRTEDFYFNISKAELLESDLRAEGGIEETLKRIVASKDRNQITDLFKGLILKSYGVKSADGRRFDKSDILSNEFEHSAAYSELFTEFLKDTDSALSFCIGIMPKELQEAANEKRSSLTIVQN